MSWVDIGCLVFMGLMTWYSLARIIYKMLPQQHKNDFSTFIEVFWLSYFVSIILMLVFYKLSLMFQH